MALNYLVREKIISVIPPYKKWLCTVIYFRRVFTFVLCSNLDYKEREKSKYSSTGDVFVAEPSPIEILGRCDQVRNVYSHTSCYWSFSNIARRI